MKLPSSLINTSQMARCLGFTLLALIIYAMISAIIFLASLILLQKQIIPDLPWIAEVQQKLYFGGARNVWQAQPDCVVFDQDVIYKPKNGICHFNNVEFKTEQHFSAEGRYTGVKPKGMGIAVLGDSHAMGWGIGDEETFSAVLQRLSGRPVYNLAVSSYGTVRELMRMAQSGLLDKIDTVIIQYCDNDLEENVAFRPISLQVAQQKFAVITEAPTTTLSSKLKTLKKGYWFAFSAPFSRFKKRLFPKKAKDFSQHYQPFINAFKQHTALKDKRILVFYSNAHGKKFSAFPLGQDQQLPNIEFVDMHLVPSDYYRIDDHLTSAGHHKIAQYLFDLIRPAHSQP